MDKSKIYLDLSKCTEEERKHTMKLVNFKMGYDNTVPYLMFFGKRTVGFTDVTMDKNELTYPEFIKLFEGGESDGWIKIESEKDLPKEKGNYFVFTVDKSIETIYVDGDISVMQHTSNSWIRHFTHYQPIIQPEPPKF